MDALDQQNFVASWNKLSDHLGSQFKNWIRAASNESDGDGDGDGNEQQLQKGGEVGRRLKNLRDRMNRGKDDDGQERDPALATASRHNCSN